MKDVHPLSMGENSKNYPHTTDITHDNYHSPMSQKEDDESNQEEEEKRSGLPSGKSNNTFSVKPQFAKH